MRKFISLLMTATKYCRTGQQDRWGGSGSPDGKTVLEADDDAAQAVLGEGWRIPTAKEFEALAWWCNHEWTAQDGVYGIKVTSTVNGQSIFFPAAGYRSATSIWNTNEGEGFKGFYWTSSLNPKDALYGSISSIFLPAAGVMSGMTRMNADSKSITTLSGGKIAGFDPNIKISFKIK